MSGTLDTPEAEELRSTLKRCFVRIIDGFYLPGVHNRAHVEQIDAEIDSLLGGLFADPPPLS